MPCHPTENTLFYGDNLDVLRRHISDESVDLIYLDPPFNSNQDYNVLFGEHDTKSAAQIKAFGDTWTWDTAAAEAFDDVVGAGGAVADALVAFQHLLSHSDMLAYLSMMAPRLVALRRVLKPTGSIYLHCDPTASHYLKMLMDAVFGPATFRSEIIWKRSSAHSDTKQGRAQHGRIHDVLLFYTKSETWTWNPMYTDYDESYVASFYRYHEPDGRLYRLSDMTGPGGAAKGNPQYEVLGVTRYWRYSKERMQELIASGRIYQSGPGRVPQEKRYLDEMPGVPIQDMWTDIQPIGAQARERLGYPTQKPVALLERIIEASSDVGDQVLDPFCGCGTTIDAAQRLGRKWIGIDITHLSVNLMKHRLADVFAISAPGDYKVIGEPTDLESARELAGSDPYQFQFWVLGLVGARPVEEKKGMDRGIDGRIYFRDGGPRSKVKSVIISVKAGRTNPAHVRDLRGTIERESAAVGVLITMAEPTREMRKEAASAGFYESEIVGSRDKVPRIQLRTVKELLEGKRIALPAGIGKATFAQAEKFRPEEGEQQTLAPVTKPAVKRAATRKPKE